MCLCIWQLISSFELVLNTVVLACHLVHYNQCDNSFVLGSVCRLWVPLQCGVQTGAQSRHFAVLPSKELCCLAPFVGKFWLQTPNSGFLWCQKPVKGFGQEKRTAKSAGYKRSWFKSSCIVGCSFETAISLHLKIFLIWNRVINWTEFLSFLKVCPDAHLRNLF